MKSKQAEAQMPSSMCEYLGHFKQAKYLRQGHNFSGNGFTHSSLFREDGTRIDFPDAETQRKKAEEQNMVSQMMAYKAPKMPQLPVVTTPVSFGDSGLADLLPSGNRNFNPFMRY